MVLKKHGNSDLLPVGVVDSGGQGLAFIYNGFFEALTGKQFLFNHYKAINRFSFSGSPRSGVDYEHVSAGDVEFGYWLKSW